MVHLDSMRTDLVGALLRCDDAVHDIHETLARGAAGRAQLVDLAEATRGLLAAAEVLDPAAPEYWRAVGYGIPNWLRTNPAHGVVAAFNLLASNETPLGLEHVVDGGGRPLVSSDDLELLLDVAYRLEALSIPQARVRLLPGRIGDAVHSFADLSAALLSERHATLSASTLTLQWASGLERRMAQQLLTVGPTEPVTRELLIRMLRVDIAALHRGGPLAIVLGLEVTLTEVNDPHVQRDVAAASGTKVSKSFRAGVDAGHREAIRMLESIDAPAAVVDPLRRLRFRCTELGDESGGLDGGSAALPVAVHVVAAAFDLVRPPWVITGAISKDGALIELSQSAAQAKAESVEEDGLWQGLAGCFSAVIGPPSLPLAGRTLIDVCAELWPNEWPIVRRRNTIRRLADAGCSVRIGMASDPLALRDEHGEVIGVSGAQCQKVLDHIRHYPAVPLVLEGPRSVGKSWTARAVADELERDGWLVLVLNFKDGRLPLASAAGRLAELAMSTLEVVDHARTLIVIEDLEVVAEATDLQSVLLEVADVSRCPVLAVALAQGGSGLRWQQDLVQVVTMPYDTESLAALAESLLAAYPGRFGAAAGQEGQIAAASRGDRWWLVRLLDGAGRIAVDTAVDQLPYTYLADRVGDLSGQQRHAIELLAAFSAIGQWAPAGQLRGLDAAALRRMGAWYTVRGPNAFWRLRSPAAINAILQRRHRDFYIALQEPLDEVLCGLIDRRDTSGFLQFMQHVSGVHDRKVANLLTQRRHRLIADMLVLYGDALSLALTLDLLRALPEGAQRRLLEQLVDLLTNTGWPTSRVADMVTCLRVVQDHQHLLPWDGDTDRAIDDRWELLLRGLENALQPRARSMRPEDALGLLNALERLRRPNASRSLITTLCIHGLDRINAARGGDLLVAIAMSDVVRRLSRRGERPAGARTPLEEFVGSAGLRRVADRHYVPRSASEYFIQLALQEQGLVLGGQLPTTAEIEQQLLVLLPRTPLLSLTQSLHQLRKQHSAVLGRLRAAGLHEAVAARMNSESPLAVAQFMQIMVRMWPRSAGQLLYDGNSRVRSALALSLAARILRGGDRRVLSMSLEAFGTADEEYYGGFGGFGEFLLDRVRPMMNNLKGERPKIVLNLVRGVLAVDFDRRHVEQLRPQFVKYLVEEFGKEKTGGAEAEIALALSRDDVLNGFVLADLRAELDAGRIRRTGLIMQMKRADSPGALTHYHRLAMALDPQLVNEYRDTRPSIATIVQGIRDRRLPVVLDAVQAVGRTLDYGREHAATADMLTAIEGDAGGWARRLLKLRNPLDAAKAVRLLSKLDESLAREVLASSGDATGPESGGIMALLLHGRAEPYEAIELLDAISSVQPELGRSLVDGYLQDGGWNRRLGALLDVDDPGVLGQALYRLGKLTMNRVTPDLRRLRDYWSDSVGSTSSPWSLGQLLRGVLAVDSGTGRLLAGRVDGPRLQSRLVRTRGRDGGGIPLLLEALASGGQHDLSKTLVGGLAITSLRRLSLRNAVDLARVVGELRSTTAAELGHRLYDDVLLPALDQQLVADPDDHLLQIGWLACVVSRLGVAPPSERWSSPTNLEHQWARLWAETWLAPSEGRAAELARLLDGVGMNPVPGPAWRSAVIVVAAARAGRLEYAKRRAVKLLSTGTVGLPWRKEVEIALRD